MTSQFDVPVSMEEDSGNNDHNSSEDHRRHLQAPPPAAFAKDAKVYALDAHHYYPATVKDIKYDASTSGSSGGTWHYKIHYHGWNARWDCWRTADQISTDPAALQAAGLLATAAKTESTPQRKRKSADDGTTASATKSPRKRRSSATSITSNSSLATLPFAAACELPFTLQTVLVDEYERLTRPADTNGVPQRLLHKLPAAVTVQQVLQQYQKKASRHTPQAATADDVQTFCTGLRNLFEASLPTCLLYPQERPQYEAFLRSNADRNTHVEFSKVYGCEYLLRLYVRLPNLMPQQWGSGTENNVNNSSGSSSSSSSSTATMTTLLSDLLVVLQKNRQACFGKADYRRPTRDEWLDSEVRYYEHSLRQQQPPPK